MNIPSVGLRSVYSVFHPDDLASCLSRAWFDGRPVYCELLSRSWSDVYRVHVGESRYAARIWRSGFHSAEQIAFSCRCVEFFGRGGVPVGLPLPFPGGGHHQTVQAPEGPRHVAVFEWLHGVPIGSSLTVALAREVGQLLARLHVIGRGYDLSPPPIDTAPAAGSALDVDLRRALEHRDIDYDNLLNGVLRVERDVATWGRRGLPRGLIHGDFHHSNVLRKLDGTFALIDFDDVGVGPLVQDIASIRWALEFLGQAPGLFDAVLEGYQLVRRLSPDERAAIPSFMAERDCWNIRGWAANINVLGDPQGRFDKVLSTAIRRFNHIPT